MRETKLTYRKCKLTDLDYLMWLRKETMDEHLQNSGISLSEEDNQNRVMFEFNSAKLIFINDIKIGLLKVLENEDSIEIIQIQINPKFQGIGIGKKVIRSVIENNAVKKLPIKLSVLKSNKAKNLYENIGFKIISEDDDSFNMYYKPAYNSGSYVNY